MRVLFVCSGNICRSPMAAEYLRHRAARSGLDHVVVDSAGTLGIEGVPATPEAVLVLREIGLDLTGHRSKGLNPAQLRTSDRVIAMAACHLAAIERARPGGMASTELLRAFEEEPRPRSGAPDVDDPIGEDIEVYRRQFEVIRRSVDHLVLYLKHGRAGADAG